MSFVYILYTSEQAGLLVKDPAFYRVSEIDRLL
jgi:hypothetical protein